MPIPAIRCGAAFTLFATLTLLIATPAGAAICDDGSQPSVGISSTEPNEFGEIIVSIPYSFPNTDSELQRYVDFFYDGVFWRGEYMREASGTWEFPHSVACTTGTHTLTAGARACDRFFAQAGTTVSTSSKPTVSISTTGPGSGGTTTATVNFSFPNTSSPLQRRVDVYKDGTWYPGGYQNDQTGSYTITTTESCSSNWHAVATACDKFGDPRFTAEDDYGLPEKQPTVSVSLLKIDFDDSTKKATILATIAYDLKTGGTLHLDLENWTDADGHQTTGGTLQTWQVPGIPIAGTQTLTFLSESGAQQLSVIAKATNTCGTVKKSASVDCATCPGASANPVYYSDGNMRLTDGEPLPPVAGRSLVRTYNSDEQVVALFGRGWTTLFDRRLIVHTDAVSIITETNEVVRFEPAGGGFRQTWPTARKVLGQLQYDRANAAYSYRPPGATEVAVFRAVDGRVVGIRDAATARDGAIAYDADGRPATFTDLVTGVAWNFTYDGTQRRVSTITVADHPELVWSYLYDGNGNLTTVSGPLSSTWRTYEYAADRMTASSDALGNLIESHTYDTKGFAISSTGDVDEIANIEFGLTGAGPHERITRVTYKTGAVAEHVLRPVGGAWRTVQVTGGCASCGTHDATYVYDNDGRIIREQGADGYVSVTAYAGDHVSFEEGPLQPAACNPAADPQRCRRGPDALAAASLVSNGASVRTTYEYGDLSWPDKITATSRPSVLEDGETFRNERAYHSVTGGLAMTKSIGWTGAPATNATRINQTTFYDAGGGTTPAFDPGGTFASAWLALPQPALLPKSVDGPRTDVQDISSMVYYPIDATVPALLRGKLAATKNAAGHIAHYEAYDVFGNATRVVDPNGVATEMTYDALGRLATITTKGIAGCDANADPLCATDLTTVRTYTAIGGPVRLEQMPRGGTTAYTYDARGRLATMSRGPSETDLRERVESTYDPLTGKKSLERTLAFESGTWVEKTRQTFTYDNKSRLLTVTHADGVAVHYTYDPGDRVATVRDENHSIANTTYDYDPAGRLALVTQMLAGTPGGAITTGYQYDTAGNLTSVTDPNGNITSYVYDDFGQILSQQSPVTGVTAYVYDAGRNLTSTTDANEATTIRAYDELGRVTSANSTRASNTETISWSYDDATAGRFAIGRLASMTDPSGSTQYHYERRGLLREETRTLEGAQYTYTTSFQYDADGNRAVINYPSTQLAIEYGFDYAGRPTSASGVVTTASYLPFGPLKDLLLANGTTQAMVYDTRYRLMSNTLTSPAETLASYNYGYDPAGNVTSILDTLEPGYNRTFQYDDLNRLTVADTGFLLWKTGSYVWDRMGNLLSVKLGEIPKGPSDPLDFLRDRRKRLESQENIPLGRSNHFAYAGTTSRLLGLYDPVENEVTRLVQYDAAGNETQYIAARAYSPRNLLATVADTSEPGEPLQHTIAYTYDGRGVRVIRTESPADGPNTTARRFSIYSPELHLLAVTSDDATNVWGFSAADKNVAYEIVWFAGRPVAQVTPAGPRLYTFADHLGTPILQTDATATIAWRAEYEPFGNIYEMRDGLRTSQPLRFPGQEVAMTWEGQEENYNIFRWYRSGWGRYTQSDPLLQHTTRSELHQEYAYGLANPARFTDPRGLFIVDGSCKKCEALDPKANDMSTYIIPEVSAWCKTKLSAVANLQLRKCMAQRCATGIVKCESDCDSGVYGKAPGALAGKLGTWITKHIPTNTAVVCLNAESNYFGEGGNTVVHEWAHTCGCDSDVPGECDGIPGEAKSTIYKKKKGNS